MSKLQTQDKSADFEGIARISQVSGLGMLTLRGNFSDKKFQAGLKKATSLSLPVPRQIEQAGGLSLAWMSPDEALLIGPEDEVSEVLPLLEAALKNCHAMLVDVSDARAVFCNFGRGGAQRGGETGAGRYARQWLSSCRNKAYSVWPNCSCDVAAS